MTIFIVNLLLAVGSFIIICCTLGFGAVLIVPVFAGTQAVMFQSLVEIQRDRDALFNS